MKLESLFALLIAATLAQPALASPKPQAKQPAPSAPSEPAIAAVAGPAVSPNDAARFLAGLPVGGPLEALSRTPAWQAHALEIESAWQRMEMRQLSKVRVWAKGVPSSDSIYYFFSGPDFLYADALFPGASTYILCAIEPIGVVGEFRALDQPNLAAALGRVRQSLGSMLKFHYFITKELRVDLAQEQLGGALPILYVFLARGGHTIRSVESVANGVKIRYDGSMGGFRGGKTLYYFRTDLSNGGDNGAFFDFCTKHRGATSLLKSASYLLHTPDFSRCRDFLLQNSRAIVQDDSGIPYRDFEPKVWNVRLFGSYGGTEGMFAKYRQPDLLAAYRGLVPAPLGFAFGYQWQSDKGTLMIATKR